MLQKRWLIFAITTTVFWGLWGALTSIFASEALPSTVVYSIWAVTMIIPCYISLTLIKWKLDVDKKSIIFGSTIGFLGCGGQMILFKAIDIGPAYLIFPIISLSPLVTIFMSMFFLKERATKLGVLGIALALVALPLFEYSPAGDEANTGYLWFFLALIIMAAWGLQAYCMKFSNAHMSAESIFFYMTITALALVPVALLMTDFNEKIDMSMSVLFSNAAIQILNALGALCLVYAFRYGKAIIVAPLTNAGSPLITSVLVIIAMSVEPSLTKTLGIVLAVVAALILAIEPEDQHA
ncbi:hypothetical protein TDB9533_03724 [Thalassocella blandensis]|nr:hypothetical protein TDB9533_03724 [Thalassocella blandensis]